jgi:hypothetical protein
MGLPKPYRRTVRQLADGSYANSGNGNYVVHPRYAEAPEHYIRAFLLLQKDLIELFDYIEPADKNLPAYSFRVHELLLRACVEVEANCKAILSANGSSGDNMRDYQKIEQSHKLSGYRVRFPTWHGTRVERTPFAAWATQSAPGSLPWYQVYTTTKHNRHNNFKLATFEPMLDAVCGCLVILSSQFHDEDFSSFYALGTGGRRDGMELATGGYFLIRFPDWLESERYSFDWSQLSQDPDPFVNYLYPSS